MYQNWIKKGYTYEKHRNSIYLSFTCYRIDYQLYVMKNHVCSRITFQTLLYHILNTVSVFNLLNFNAKHNLYTALFLYFYIVLQRKGWVLAFMECNVKRKFPKIRKNFLSLKYFVIQFSNKNISCLNDNLFLFQFFQ